MSSITHYDGCWSDPKHHACAVREINKLRSDVLALQDMRQKADAEIERLRELLRSAGVPEWVTNARLSHE